MLSARTDEDPRLPAISPQRQPLSPEEEAQLEWLFCLASSLERLQARSADASEPEQPQVETVVLLTFIPFPKAAGAVLPAF